MPPPPQFKNDAERQTYERARKRAQAEAGFFVHLMWYGIIIGFLFIINMMTVPGYLWVVWPALGWGFGLASHFSAVYGWRWVHDRVFQPAVAREVQREVLQEKEQLRTEKQASLDELTATFAHEIRNPIAAAKSLVQQMGEDPTSHENVEYAKVALDELARVERSVSHLLKYAKEEDYKFENVNLAWVLDGALTQMRSKLEANSVAVSRAYLSGPTVRADADKLRQVFSNIIDNAIDAMESTTGERRLEFAIQNNGAGMAAVRIRDNGCGIADDKIAKIFNPFYTSKTNGTGLGLGVAKKVIDSHRGTIEVHSKVGQGTEFVLAIPLSDSVRDNDDVVQSSAESPDIVGEAAAEPAPQNNAGNNNSGAATTPIIPLAAGGAVRADLEATKLKGRLLVVDDERGIVIALKGLFTKEGYEVETAESGEEALEKVKAGLFHVIITDLSMKGMSGLELLKHVRELDPACAVLMITAFGTQRIAVEAMKAGAEDYLPKPFDNDELRMKVRKVMETQLLKREHNQLLEQVRLETGVFENMVGRSRAMMRVFETIDKVAPTDVTVLIRGESGTGKELVARAIHFRSPRARKPFIAVNCAAFSRELVESELFGHEKGAFTGAVARREGKFEAANGGTLFLDEIGDMALETQAKLLRVLQEQVFERIGGNQPLSVDVRIIAATNQDLEAMIEQGKFREDLYYRLKVVEVRVPPVRERREDVPLMVQHFIAEARQRFSAPEKQLTPEAMRACVEAPWKGNARSLKAAIEQAVILSSGANITPEDLFAGSEPEGDHASAPAANASNHVAAASDNGESAMTFREAKEKFVGDWERDFFVRALRATGGNISRAAERTGMYRQSFQQKMRELGITLADIGLAPKSDAN